jgi:hypothetical protein
VDFNLLASQFSLTLAPARVPAASARNSSMPRLKTDSIADQLFRDEQL